jgi:hypothetical protein
MEKSIGDVAISTTSLASRAELGNDNLAEHIETALSPIRKAPAIPDQEDRDSSAFRSCRPVNEASIASADQNYELNNDVQITLQLVNNSIKQVANGLNELAVFYKDGRDSSKKRDSGLKTRDQSDDESEDGDDEMIKFPYPERVIPEVEFCNRSKFYNTFPGEERGYCIEVLKVSGNFAQELEGKSLNTKADQDEYSGNNQPDRNDGRWIQKVRIQSSTIIDLFISFYDADHGFRPWRANPVVFERPFRCCIHYQDRMKRQLKQLEEEVTKTSTHKSEETSEKGKHVTFEMILLMKLHLEVCLSISRAYRNKVKTMPQRTRGFQTNPNHCQRSLTNFGAMSISSKPTSCL